MHNPNTNKDEFFVELDHNGQYHLLRRYTKTEHGSFTGILGHIQTDFKTAKRISE